MTKTHAPPLRVLHAAAEIFPLVKTGGLADVVGEAVVVGSTRDPVRETTDHPA